MPPIPAKKQSRPTEEVQQKAEECQGIHVDPAFYAMLSNRHLNAKDWSECSALAVLLYWWLCDKVTEAYDEKGVSIGVVMFGRPVDFSTIADDKNLGTTWRAVQRNMKHLDDRGFIRRKRHQTTQGYSYEVVGCAREVLPEGAVKGKDGKTYYKKPEASAAKSSKTDEPEPDTTEPEKQSAFTCPKCGLEGYGTQDVYSKHLSTHDSEPDKTAAPLPVKNPDDEPCPGGCGQTKLMCQCNPCPRCKLYFSSPDGVAECMEKHKQKDAEDEAAAQKARQEHEAMFKEIRRQEAERQRVRKEKEAEAERQRELLRQFQSRSCQKNKEREDVMDQMLEEREANMTV